MILQQLAGQRAVCAQPTKQAFRTSDRRTTGTMSRNRKRKLSYHHSNAAKCPSIPRATNKISPFLNSKSLTRSVSPGTDFDCITNLSSFASYADKGICAGNPIIKPLDAPPKLRRISTNTAPQPPSGIHVRMHSTPPKQNTRTSQFNMGNTSSREQSQQRSIDIPSIPVNPLAPAFTNNMIVQLMSNPIVFSRNLQSFPLCQTIEPSFAQSAKTALAPIIDLSKDAADPTAKKTKVCRMDGCDDEAARRTPYCKKHCGQRRCEFAGCTKCAQGRTRFCIGHGGGRRCQFDGCTKGARDKKFCASHGGGRRCNVDSCSKLAVGRGTTCTAHGGGRRCQNDSCTKSAQSSSSFCVRHGGGRKCVVTNCSKVARGKKGLCMSHASQHDANLLS